MINTMMHVELMNTTGRIVAFVGNGTEDEVNRLVDDDILPHAFYVAGKNRGVRREFNLLPSAAALWVNRKWKNQLTRKAKKKLISILWENHLLPIEQTLSESPRKQRIHAMSRLMLERSWVVKFDDLSFDLSKAAEAIWGKIAEVEKAESAVTVDEEIMGGRPVFYGTRLPVDTVLNSLDNGYPLEEILEDYPSLSGQLIADAKLYMQLHPRSGRPRKWAFDGEAKLVKSLILSKPRG